MASAAADPDSTAALIETELPSVAVPNYPRNPGTRQCSAVKFPLQLNCFKFQLWNLNLKLLKRREKLTSNTSADSDSEEEVFFGPRRSFKERFGKNAK